MSEYEYNEDAYRRAQEAAAIKAWAKRETDRAIELARDRHVQERDSLEAEIRHARNVSFTFALIAGVCAILAMLVGCGGGECDQSCQNATAQAEGKMTIQPVECAASCAE